MFLHIYRKNCPSKISYPGEAAKVTNVLTYIYRKNCLSKISYPGEAAKVTPSAFLLLLYLFDLFECWIFLSLIFLVFLLHSTILLTVQVSAFMWEKETVDVTCQ